MHGRENAHFDPSVIAQFDPSDSLGSCSVGQDHAAFFGLAKFCLLNDASDNPYTVRHYGTIMTDPTGTIGASSSWRGLAPTKPTKQPA
jgi:hypothetical protein